jgi:hypothetical protein
VRARPFPLPGRALRQQVLLPIAQPGGLLEVLRGDGRLLVPAKLHQLAVEIADVRPGAYPLLDRGQAALDRLDMRKDLGQ